MIAPRPVKNEEVKWKAPLTKKIFDVIVSKVRVRDKTAKVKPNYKAKNPMPYPYFWVDFCEIGY